MIALDVTALTGRALRVAPVVPSPQIEMPFDRVLAPVYVAGQTNEDRAAAFHRLNPHVYRTIASYARILVDQDRAFSIRMIWENVRFAVRTIHPDDEFTMNNVFTPFYSGLLAQEPWMPKGMLKRRQRADRATK